MWNKRGDDGPSTAPARAPGSVVHTGPSRTAAVIGASMQIKGEIHSAEELYVDGEIDGALVLEQALTVGPNGKVKANIKARDVLILGSVKGNVEVSEKIAIKDKGSLVGDIKTAGIIIDDGAYFKGSIDIIRPAPPRKPAEASAAAASSA